MAIVTRKRTNPKKRGPSASEALADLRACQKDARDRGLDKLSDDEINSVIARVRRRLRRAGS